MKLDSKIPAGPIQEKWTQHRFNMKLGNPPTKRRSGVMALETL